MKAKVKGHASFPNHSLHRPVLALQATSAILTLTLTVPAVVTLPAAFLENHRVTATLGTKIAGDA